jgi:hypothetical protein
VKLKYYSLEWNTDPRCVNYNEHKNEEVQEGKREKISRKEL